MSEKPRSGRESAPPPPRPSKTPPPLPSRATQMAVTDRVDSGRSPESLDRVVVRLQRVSTLKVYVPEYQTPLAAGMDLHAALEGPLNIAAFARVLVPTGIAIALPPGYEGQVRPRSGLAWRTGLTILNSPGTIDADFRGEIRVLLVNLGNADCVIEPGERIAQLVVARHATVSFAVVNELDETARGGGGYGSTGRS